MNSLIPNLVRRDSYPFLVLVLALCVLTTFFPHGKAHGDQTLLASPLATHEDHTKIRIASIDNNSEPRQVIRAHKSENSSRNNISNDGSSRSYGQSALNSLGSSNSSKDIEFQLHYVTELDTRESLARKYLGDSSEWLLIALHNQVNPAINPAAGTVLRIPVKPETSANLSQKNSLSSSASLSTVNFFNDKKPQFDSRPVTFSDVDGGSFQVDSQAHLLAARVDLNSDIPGADNWSNRPEMVDRDSQFGEPAVVSRKIDMFAGEARVFGKVDVSRVAVGNGSILRAEVLANGDLLAIAQAAGSSSLHLWHKDESRSDLNIRVSAEDPEYRVKLEKSVRMRVKMIEFRRSALKRIGIDWGDSIEGPVFATAGDFVSNSLFRPPSSSLGDNLPLGIEPFSTSFGLATQLTSRINFLVTNGDAEMLAEPVLSCINGGTAKFLAGGEVPYPTVGANGQTNIEFREYGIRLEVSPVADENGNIQAAILTEVSSIDPSVTVLGAPGLLTRRTQTQVSVTGGDTIVIAGLLQSESGKDIDALPGIGRIPILGKLFRSDNLRNNVSELVIFITPEIVDPSRGNLSRADQSTHEYAASRLQLETEKLRKAWIK